MLFSLSLRVILFMIVSFQMNKNIYELSYKMKKDLHKKIFRNVSLCVLFFLAINLLFEFIIYPVKQRSISMEPDVKCNSRMFVTPLPFTPKRGHVVVLRSRSTENLNLAKKALNHLVGFFTLQKFYPFASLSDMSLISNVRRIVALPGDTIYMKDYILYVKPAGAEFFLTEFELTKVRYNIDILIPPSSWDATLGVKGNFSETTLSKDEYFVLGDNRLSSMDSRFWGSIPKSMITGRVLLTYFPLNKIRLF